MVNEEIIQQFIHDLGTLTCGEIEVINYFRSFGEEPEEYMSALANIPGIHIVNEKIWFQA